MDAIARPEVAQAVTFAPEMAESQLNHVVPPSPETRTFVAPVAERVNVTDATFAGLAARV